MESWYLLLPDYEFKEWNESNSPMGMGYMQAAYSRQLWSKVSNYARLHALFTEGGIYLDLDMELIKSLDPLLTNECFVGFQSRKKCREWVNNAIIGAVPGHPFMSRCMDITTSTWRKYGEFYRSPMVTTQALLRMGLKKYHDQVLDGVKIYPTEYFYPFNWKQSYDRSHITGETFCVHYWEMNWKNPNWLYRRQKDLQRIVKLVFAQSKDDYISA
jgi:mannosyltransferase OCH1-like enzyme